MRLAKKLYNSSLVVITSPLLLLLRSVHETTITKSRKLSFLSLTLSSSSSVTRMSNVDKILRVEDALKDLDKVKSVLKRGGIIAVPTDTIYGVACLACNTSSLQKIYSIKGRDMAKPLAISVGNVHDLEKWSHVTVNVETLEKLLPGPVTLVFDRKSSLPAELNPNTKSIGIRIPDYKFMIELARFVDEPIALTSANLSNQPSSLKIQEFESLWKDLDLIIDGGELAQNEAAKAGSTVIELNQPGTFKIIRNGSHYESVVNKLENDCKLQRRY